MCQLATQQLSLANKTSCMYVVAVATYIYFANSEHGLKPKVYSMHVFAQFPLKMIRYKGKYQWCGYLKRENLVNSNMS